MSESTPQPTYSESQIVADPGLRRKWDTLYLLGVAPAPLPVSSEDAWYNFVMNGHLRYALPNERFIRARTPIVLGISRSISHLIVRLLYAIALC